ncbi:putative cytochrome P450 [Pseudovirgaria hyperparasitica]|uniref:Putative cytochrome P450 n=1 Tax=Pseudovirgaria hyperparasitica TaxID=470096 RepID=A0A6A6W2K3_9PEZI|nr:putative cytochrome P450 [Pseudovirgaria hyperparasitica]KAF2756359.1 putative cytochrome P450 [Pseudovirgaria hyperparasitica]
MSFTLLGIFTIVLLAGATTVTYNIFLHPLRNYPGPLVARVTDLWYKYHLLNGTLAFEIKAAHDKYGEVVRVSPNELGYINPLAWQDIFGHRQGQPENAKDEQSLIRESREDDIISAGREHHSFLRRLMAHGFSDKALREQQPTVNSYVSLLIQRLQEKAEHGDAINVQDWYNFITFDIIGHLAYSESFDCLSNSTYHPWIRVLRLYVRAAAYIFAVNRFGILRKLMWLVLVRSQDRRSRTDHHELVHEKLLRRLDRNPDYTDLMQNMIDAYRLGKLSLGDLSTNSRVFIVAGSETTATLLTGFTYFLGAHPDIQSRVTTEIRQTCSSADEIDMNMMGRMPYFIAALEESLRMYPPGAGTFTRVTPPEGAMICGKHVPGGTGVGITMYAMNYSAENWQNPEVYDPERFLPDETGKWSGDRKEALQPFSVGPRNCIGRNLARMEMRLIMAQILWHFDIALAPNNVELPKQKIYVVWDKTPLWVHLKPVVR